MRWVAVLVLAGCSTSPYGAGPWPVDVKERGAIGDGKTDDTAAIQAALDSLPDGGTITIPDGTYLIAAAGETGGLRPHSHQHLELAEGAVLRVIPTDADTYELLQIAYATDVTVRGGTLIGDRADHLGQGGEWGHGLAVRSSDHVTIDRVTAREFWGDGFYIGRHFRDPPPSSDVSVTGCVSDHNRRQGLSITDAERVSVSGCVFENTSGTNPQAGIDLEPSFANREIRGVTLTNNLFIGNVIGVLIVGLEGLSDDDVVANNTITNNSQWGVALIGYPTNVSIGANVIEANGIGAWLDRASGEQLIGNRIANNVQQGIAFGMASDNAITYNQVQSNGDATGTFDNIDLSSDSDHNSFSHNVVRGGAVSRYGIQITSADCDANRIVNNDLLQGGVIAPLLDLGTATVVSGNVP